MENIKSAMPNQTFPTIGSATKDPTCKEVLAVYALACANTRKIPSNRGDGLLGHFAIIAGPGRYAALSTNNVAYVPPPQPPQQPLPGASAAARDTNVRLHAAAWKEFNTHKYVEEVILQQLLVATHTNYTACFKTPEGGYTCTANTLMQHLITNFGQKTDADLDANKADMKKPWDSKVEPIQALFNRIEEGRLFDPSITPEEYIRDTKNIICKNDGFQDAFKTWESMATNAKTWTNLQTHFRAADKSHRAYMALRTTTTTPPTTYPGSANSATMTPATTITPPTEGEMLCKAMAAMTKAMNKLTSTTPTTDSSTTTTSTNSTRPPRRTNPPNGGREPTPIEAATMSYCWSHGYCVKTREGREDHTSGTCNRPNVGHKTDATAANKLGGECRICNSWQPNWRMPNGE